MKKSQKMAQLTATGPRFEHSCGLIPSGLSTSPAQAAGTRHFSPPGLVETFGNWHIKCRKKKIYKLKSCVTALFHGLLKFTVYLLCKVMALACLSNESL